MTVVVREARPDEYEAIGDVVVAAYEASGVPLGGYAEELRDVATRARTCTILVAIDEGSGRIVGGATYVPGPDDPLAEVERAGEAGVRMLGVAPDAQGRGVGQALVEALIAKARADGKGGISLLTIASRSTAQRLYLRNGFVRDPERDWQVEPDFLLLCFALAFDTRATSTTAAAPAPPADGA